MYPTKYSIGRQSEAGHYVQRAKDRGEARDAEQIAGNGGRHWGHDSIAQSDQHGVQVWQWRGWMRAGQAEGADAGHDATEGQGIGRFAPGAIREDPPGYLARDADEARGPCHRRGGDGMHPVIHEVGDLMDDEHLGDEVPREIDPCHPPEPPGVDRRRQRPVLLRIQGGRRSPGTEWRL